MEVGERVWPVGIWQQRRAVTVVLRRRNRDLWWFDEIVWSFGEVLEGGSGSVESGGVWMGKWFDRCWWFLQWGFWNQTTTCPGCNLSSTASFFYFKHKLTYILCFRVNNLFKPKMPLDILKDQNELNKLQ